jgi:hypothetical protein
MNTYVICIILILILILILSVYTTYEGFNTSSSSSTSAVITPDLTLSFTLNINALKNEETLILKKDNLLITILPNLSKLRIYLDNTYVDMNNELPLNVNNNIKIVFNHGINEENGWMHSQFISELPDKLPEGSWKSTAQDYSVKNGILYSELLNAQGTYVQSNAIITPTNNMFNNNNGSFYPSNPVPTGYNNPCCYMVNLNKKQFYQLPSTNSSPNSKTKTLNTTNLSGLTYMGQLTTNLNYSKPSLVLYLNGTQILTEQLKSFPQFNSGTLLSTENTNNTFYSLTNQIISN